ncbi:nitrite reductase small subunit NirD [Aeromonas veronii]|uniref:nitrite reductase small subunit NirD n=1 Tax=Aeromonas allosaccharophila TaxID=656 RepID=UPI00067908C4|nr:nitrite reductase small subunit NirD [Aeromonas allosaccharophila]
MTSAETQWQAVGEPSAEMQWQAVCEQHVLEEGLGRSVLLQGEVIALFRCGGHIYALDGMDPVAAAPVIALGLVGDCQGEPMVASPIYKQRYSLRDGRCLDNSALRLRSWRVKVDGEQVWLAGCATD